MEILKGFTKSEEFFYRKDITTTQLSDRRTGINSWKQKQVFIYVAPEI